MSNILHNVTSPPSRASTPGYAYPPSYRLPSEGTLPTDDEISLSSVRLSKYSSRHRHPAPELLPYQTDTAPESTSSPLSFSSPTLPYDQLPSPSQPPAEPASSPEPPNRRIPARPTHSCSSAPTASRASKPKPRKTTAAKKRQQVLSRVAGEAWHLLAPEARLQWQEKAAKVFAEHQAKYPGYKFTPAPKGSARKGKHAGEEDEEMSVEKIRTEILNIPGLAVRNPAPRKRAARNKAHHSPNDAKPNPSPSYSFSTPAPAYYQDVSPLTFAPQQMDASMPVFFPNPSMPHFLDSYQWRPPASSAGPRIAEQRRPSTSLGFRPVAGPAPQDPIPRPASANSRPAPGYANNGMTTMTFPQCDNDFAPNQYPMPFDNVFSDEFMFQHLNYDYARMADNFGGSDGYADYNMDASGSSGVGN
ncbi:hypothetical protein BDZ89DRAFT_1131549 [Hymenopellis radicata]|nr:hypothetical protein BDZ89DRAFT_1131549 [Hymenopellis radicata]